MTAPVSGPPRVSVVVPVRNMEAYVGEAVESALAQSPPPLEVVAVDDGSTDGTRGVLAGFGERVRVLPGPARGASAARNLGVGEARGDWIAFLDADDLWYPGKLALQAAKAAAGHDFVFTDYARGPDPAAPGPGRLAGYRHPAEGRVFDRLLRENFVFTSTVLVRRESLVAAGGFDESIHITEDIDLWLRLARTVSFGWVREVCAFKRDHGTNLTVGPGYPASQVEKWERFHARYRDTGPANAAFLAERVAEARYEAGRQALRGLDTAAARGWLGAVEGPALWRARALPWYLLACLPRPLLRPLLAGKRRLAG